LKLLALIYEKPLKGIFPKKNLLEMPAHIVPVACLKQAQKNKGIKKPQ